ncbi:hypothetical protein HPB48_023226 [Haemaphysalis longicornis]|uniref:CUB domain-containing protein n=1 Tax=Haemaphysalis longicornis TaxID=44386 RepID=A0A9J6H6G5_HAELO|nr:hypothetical protein HPB48_023226 [Haemaphysalis longicornis]
MPDNTVCTFQFQGRSRFDRVWLYFTSYFVPDKQPWSGVEKCDVSQLEVYDSPVFDGDTGSAFLGHIGQDRGRIQDSNDANQSFPARLIGRYCEKSTPRMCSHANDYPGLLPPRPCHVPSESYLSSSAKMALRYKVFANADVALKTGSFVARYEFIDTSQNGAPADNSRCYRVFRSRTKSRGRIASPRNTFFYGRGGQQELQCTYRFQGTSSQRRYGEIRITEYWLALTIQVGCICSNSSVLQSPLEITSIGSEVLLTFTVKGMTVREDFTNFGFEGNYEFLPPADCGGDTGLLRGNVGEADLSPNFQSDDTNPMNPGVGAYRSGVLRRCRWLLEASPDKFLYLKVAGGKREVRECGDSRLLVHSGDEFEQTIIICAYPDVGITTEESQVSVDIFSPSWSNGTPSRKKAAALARPERLMLETVCTGSSPSFKIRWMEVTRPFMTTSAGQSLRNVDCLYECPELDACISPELWCDGAKHCPSGYDEVPENCSRFPTVPVVLGCVGAVAIFFVALATLVLMRRSCQFRKCKESSSSRPAGCEDVPMENI